MRLMEQIRKHYGVPAKRGMEVMFGDNGGHITGTPRSGGMYVNVRDFDGYMYTFHPLELNYVTENGIVIAAKVKERFDSRIEQFNEQLNKDAS